MKIMTLFLALLLSFSALQSQTTQDATISLDNPEYLEWVSEFGFRFLNEIKPGQESMLATEVLDSEGNAIPENVTSSTFDISKYDFNTVIAPEKNILIKVASNKAILIYSKQRQEILFNRYLINKAGSND